MKLKQTIGSQKKEFELINETELVIKEKYLLSTKERTVDIEYIGHQKTIKTHSRKSVNIIGYFFIIIATVCWITPFFTENQSEKLDVLIWGGLFMTVLAFTCFKAPMDNTLTLSGGHINLIFFLDSPSKEEVETFVAKLIYLSKEKIKEKYSRIDSDLPEETFMNQMNWLLNNKFISENEYQEKKNEYKIGKLTK
ncbi:hypothetical protein [Cellulophaga sp. L1A9]|uniref:hypothetical protein n=1 Tax=Cellulophaga sp. L1A9 TaxID=2686362 RepID=UPI00131B2922|nr:hypothetical protein [Cellulophaga sp. L1A9]